MADTDTSETTVEGTGNDQATAAYKGLQKVLAGRDRTISELTEQLNNMQSQLGQFENDTEYQTYRQQKDAERAKAARLAQLEALRAEFEPEEEPPTPYQHSEYHARSVKGEPSVDDLRNDLDKMTGKSSRRPDWGDILG